jgi:hypothetical protein
MRAPAGAAAPVPDLGEGARIVAEVGTEVGLPLWRALRDLRHWAADPASLVAGGAALRPDALRAAVLPPELCGPLAVVASLAAAPPPPGDARLRHACRRIVAWLDGRGAAESAADFRAALASAWPNAIPRPIAVEERVPGATTRKC